MGVSRGNGGATPIELENTNLGARSKVSVTKLCFIRDRTNTPLGANATFTGAAIACELDANSNATSGPGVPATSQATRVGTVVTSDQAGNHKINLSADAGTTFDLVTTTAVAAATPKQIEQSILGANQARTDYTNGGVAQGSFRMCTVYTNFA